MIDIKALSQNAAKDTVTAIAIANQKGIIESESDLTDLISAAIESAIEEYTIELQKLKNKENEISSIRKDYQTNPEPNY